MADPITAIPQYALSSLAKAGLRIINLQQEPGEDEHDSLTTHRDTHYLLTLATAGCFRLNLDFDHIQLAGPALLLIFPEQVHQLLAKENAQGWAISFDPSLMDPALGEVLENGLRGSLPLAEQAVLLAHSSALMGLLESLQAQPTTPHTIRASHALLTTLLSLLANHLAGHQPNEAIHKGRSAHIEAAFRQLLKQHYNTWKQPARYASELSLSVSHLTDSVRAITGLSVSAHVQQRSLLEAKRLLYGTDLSAKEISYAVGYDDPVHFGKLFRRTTGVTPLQFRQQFRD